MLQTNVKRREFCFIMDVENGNPNGDPDNEGDPRQDNDQYVLITAECIKRKIRNAVHILQSGTPGFELYVERGAILNQKIRECYEQAGVVIAAPKASKKGKKGADGAEAKAEDKDSRVSKADADKGNKRMAERYFDARWFGMVATGVGTGRLTGPLQLGMATSVLPVELVSIAGTRSAVGTEGQSEDQKGINQNWVRRNRIQHAVFTMGGHLSPFQALNTGFTEEDWSVFVLGAKQMLENDRSSTRGLMTLQQMVVFTHDDPLGNARASDLFKLIKVVPRDPNTTPRSFEDYIVTIDRSKLPAGVTVEVMYPETPEEAVIAAE